MSFTAKDVEKKWKVKKMKVKRIPLEGMMVKALVIEEGDESVPCENCSKAKFDHPDLVREIDEDWCLNCNDEAMGLNDKDYHDWVIKQVAQDKIIVVAKELTE